MSTRNQWNTSEITSSNTVFSRMRTTIESAFWGNNVHNIENLKQAYQLAKNSPGTIVTDMPVYEPEKIGLDKDSKVLLFNDGDVSARCAQARRILGSPGISEDEYSAVVREAIYQTRTKKLYHAQACIGLDKDFMIKAHLLIPEGHENIAYNWLLNFQEFNEEYIKMYKESKAIGKEGDIYVFSDPDWKNENYPVGLTIFDPNHNCAALLGMRYFGEHKKGTLTLAWGCANRNGFASCHAGQKRYTLKDGRNFVAGVFGLSGSGKSTLTHAKHDGKYEVMVLHDDAFVISVEDGSSVALEPSYFDKTQDYPAGCDDNKYLITAQNCGVTIDDKGNKTLVTEDIRNGNGRAIKSKLWTTNRLDKFENPVNAIFWIMKDETLPPVLKLTDNILAATMGATLATKRSSAERLLQGVDPDALVIEPYANPFRTYPLSDDYLKFKELFEKRAVECYIINTGSFMGKKIPKEMTLGILEDIVDNKANFVSWNEIFGMQIQEIPGFVPNLSDKKYFDALNNRIQDRINFIKNKEIELCGRDALPKEALEALVKMKESIYSHIDIKHVVNI